MGIPPIHAARGTSPFGLTSSELTYEAAVQCLYLELPMFQRDGPAAYKADLSATKRVCAALGHPENDLRFVHVAGTNGKGTVCHMVAAALQTQGHSVGLFTSPHLMDFRERIRVNGECIEEEAVTAFVRRWQAADGTWGSPSFFELTLGMALDHFRTAQCDVVVLETGMGGRLDSTNVIPGAEVCVVTNIGMDHQRFLGDNIRTIAKEKGGIFKDGVPVVLGPMRPEAQSELLSSALRSSSEVHFAQEIRHEENVLRPEWLKDEPGPVDDANRATAAMTLRVLEGVGWVLSDRAIEAGLWRHKECTGQQGRWHVVQRNNGPALVLDGAHNVDGVAMVAQKVAEKVQENGGQLHVVWGCVGDKPLEDVFPLLPREAHWYWCAADLPRSLSPVALAHRALDHGLQGKVHSSVKEALGEALDAANDRDLVWVGGSLFVVGEALRTMA